MEDKIVEEKSLLAVGLKYIKKKGFCLLQCLVLFALKAVSDIVGEALILSFKFTRNAVSF